MVGFGFFQKTTHATRSGVDQRRNVPLIVLEKLPVFALLYVSQYCDVSVAMTAPLMIMNVSFEGAPVRKRSMLLLIIRDIVVCLMLWVYLDYVNYLAYCLHQHAAWKVV